MIRADGEVHRVLELESSAGRGTIVPRDGDAAGAQAAAGSGRPGVAASSALRA
jgi:hypothetical protein